MKAYKVWIYYNLTTDDTLPAEEAKQAIEEWCRDIDLSSPEKDLKL